MISKDWSRSGDAFHPPFYPMNPYQLPVLVLTREAFTQLRDTTSGGFPPTDRPFRRWVALENLGSPEASVIGEMTKTSGVWLIGKLRWKGQGVIEIDWHRWEEDLDEPIGTR